MHTLTLWWHEYPRINASMIAKATTSQPVADGARQLKCPPTSVSVKLHFKGQFLNNPAGKKAIREAFDAEKR